MVCQKIQPPPPFQLSPSAYLPGPVINKLRPCCISKLVTPYTAISSVQHSKPEASPSTADSGYSCHPLSISAPAPFSSPFIVPVLNPSEGDFYQAHKISVALNGVAYLQSGKRYLFVEGVRCRATKHFLNQWDFLHAGRYFLEKDKNSVTYRTIQCDPEPHCQFEQGLYELEKVEDLAASNSSSKPFDNILVPTTRPPSTPYTQLPPNGSIPNFKEGSILLHLSERRKFKRSNNCECEVIKQRENVLLQLKAMAVFTTLCHNLRKASGTLEKTSLVKLAVMKLARLEHILNSRGGEGIFGAGPPSREPFRPLDLLKNVVNENGFSLPSKNLPFISSYEESSTILAHFEITIG